MLEKLYKSSILATATLAILSFQDTVLAMPKLEKNPIVIGHRGAAGYRPEHTIEGYTLAIEMGVDVIEPDLVLTKDGYMIARHEPMIGGTTDVAMHPEFANRKVKRLLDGIEYDDWFATDFTLAEIKTLRAIQSRANRDPNYNGLFAIPTLDEVIALAKQKGKEQGRIIGIYPEIKHSTYHANFKDANHNTVFGAHYFENKLLKKLHAEYGNSACAPVFIQSFEVSNLQYLSRLTHIKLAQLVDADDVNDDGSLSLVAPSKQPYDFVVAGYTKTFADLLTKEGLTFIKSYADVVAPWKPYLVKTVADGKERNGDGTLTINDRRVEGSTGVIEMAHELGLLVHTWTFRNDASGYGFTDPKKEISYYFDLGVDGLFTDFADTGVAGLASSKYARNGKPAFCQCQQRERHDADAEHGNDEGNDGHHSH